MGVYISIIAPATTASKPSLTVTTLAAPVWAAADEEAADDEPVALPLLEWVEVLEILDALLGAVVKPLLVVAAPAAKELWLEPEAVALEETAAVA